MSPVNPVSRKHALLIAGFLDPRILYHFACHVGIMTAAFMIVCAFVAAKGTRRLAVVFFRGAATPWYTQSGIVVFLCIILPCANIIFMIVDNVFFNITALSEVTTQQVRMFVFMALEFLWIALLE